MGARKLAAMASPLYSQDSFIGIPWKVDIVTFIFNSGVILGAVRFPPCAAASLTSKSHVLQDDKTPHIFFTDSFWHKMETRFIPRGLQHLLCCPLKVLCLLLPSHDWEFTKGRHNLKAPGIAAYLLIVVSGGQYKKDGVENTRLKMRMKLHFSFWWKVKPMF